MEIATPGDELLDLIHNATSRIFIVAPYMKLAVVRRLLSSFPETVSDFTCITRWLPEDIASGVCDLEILSYIEEFQGGKLLVHPKLHVKYYTNGVKTLVGSANLTARGLGWNMSPNLELLVSLPYEFPGLKSWEARLIDSSIRATEQLKEQINEQAEELKKSQSIQEHSEVKEDICNESEGFWVPRCPTPDRLWSVYCGRGEDMIVKSAFSAAKDDLSVLSPPAGLTENLFRAYMSGILKQTPLFVELDKLASRGLTDKRALEYLSERLGNEKQDEQLWYTVKEWIIYFFPNTYRLETIQEVLIRGSKIF